MFLKLVATKVEIMNWKHKDETGVSPPIPTLWWNILTESNHGTVTLQISNIPFTDNQLSFQFIYLKKLKLVFQSGL